MTAVHLPTRPTAPRVFAHNIPLELTQRPQWVVWRYELNRNGTKWTKVPYSHASGAAGVSPASSTNPGTWLLFNVAYAVYLFQRLDGVGYVLSADDPYTAIDLDHLSAWPERARPLIEKAKAAGFYCETTPSGDGLRVWVRGRLPEAVRHKLRLDGEASIEIYDDRRFLTVTGHAVTAQTSLMATPP